MRIMEIVGDIMSSNFSAVNCRSTYNGYMTAGNMMIKYQCMTFFFAKLVSDDPAKTNFDITYLDDLGLSSFSEEDNLFMSHSPDAFVKN